MNDYLIFRWAQKPKDVKTKGNSCTVADKDTITKLFEDIEKDKDVKMSAALIFEVMITNLESNYLGVHPHPKHHLLSIS